ncbi:FKBP-type peptidyl-prolyl cis-trans isomerase [Hallella bergensis]|uniref:FKBP-type peptidyl-prolyl cis-trans isomerase n=1 Tax=Hallella bergensis TaxID=242750 RepID=UPI003990C7DC
MDNKINKYIKASYQLYDTTDGQNELIEQTTDDRPFVFISGLGMVLDELEKNLVGLETGNKFDITLQPEQAYGVYSDEHVVELDKQIFFVNGKFDQANVYPNATIPLQNEDGVYFFGQVMEVSTDKVKVDLNSPLAGKTLNFKGEIVENREASTAEVADMLNKLSGGGCKGNCKCGGHGQEGGCECGGHGQDGGCCGKHHQH